MLAGVNHIAFVTSDLDRLIEFYGTVFEAKVTHDMVEERARHALIDIGRDATLHVFEMAGNPHAAASPAMFDRGHLDHIALNVQDEPTFQQLRRRLVERGASDGTVTDFGVVKTCFFRDPDGMDAEIAVWKRGSPLSFEDRVIEAYPGT